MIYTIADFLPFLKTHFSMAYGAYRIHVESLPPTYAVPDANGNVVRLNIEEFRKDNCSVYAGYCKETNTLYYSFEARR